MNLVELPLKGGGEPVPAKACSWCFAEAVGLRDFEVAPEKTKKIEGEDVIVHKAVVVKVCDPCRKRLEQRREDDRKAAEADAEERKRLKLKKRGRRWK